MKRPCRIRHQVSCEDGLHHRYKLEARSDRPVNPFCQHALATDATKGLEEEVALNLTAPIRLTAEVLARWPAPAVIIFVTSGFALVSPTRAPTYGAVKAGLYGFAEGLRRQLAPKGTHVLALLPTTTDTPATATETRKTMTTAEVAAVTLKALARKKEMALPGPIKMLPTLLRIAPSASRRMVANI